ncbi:MULTISPECIES: CC0125/CC1285 family lipoprotein [unclassified Bradyrhizobium]
MNRSLGIGLTLAALGAAASVGFAADAQPGAAPTSARGTPAQAGDMLPMVPPAKPGVFTVQKTGGDRFHLVVAGQKFNTRDEIEKYLAYRAAELTLEQKASWFTFVEARSKGDKAPEPRRDPTGRRYSFRMDYFRPAWRYKISGSPAWTSWSPFSAAAFIADDPKSITDFEVSADIVLHKGQMDGVDPLAFEAQAVSDLLINQVSPPE